MLQLRNESNKPLERMRNNATRHNTATTRERSNMPAHRTGECARHQLECRPNLLEVDTTHNTPVPTAKYEMPVSRPYDLSGNSARTALGNAVDELPITKSVIETNAATDGMMSQRLSKTVPLLHHRFTGLKTEVPTDARKSVR